MKIHNFVDFRETGYYKHTNFVNPNNLTDEERVIAFLHKKEGIFCTLKNAHEFVIEGGSNACVRIPLGGDCPLYDGIYDIWLHDCEKVHSISVVFDNVEIPITEFKQQGTSIQIPLAFFPGAPEDGVKHLFCDTESCLFMKKRLSFIPTVALQFDKMFIMVNSGASCKVSISTVYFSIGYRRELVHYNNVFYVNGAPFIARAGQVHKHVEKCQEGSGCIIT